MLAETAALCTELGHRVEQPDPVIDREAVVPTFLPRSGEHGREPFEPSHAGRPPREDEVERMTWLTAQMGDNVTAPDYVRATQAAHRLGRQMAEFHPSATSC